MIRLIKKFKMLIEEIRTVGFKNWFWFVIVLKRNEFSKRLSLSSYYFKYKRKEYEDVMMKIIYDRKRAHDIDFALSEMRYKKLKIEPSDTNDNKDIT